jgi:hypothetical protein
MKFPGNFLTFFLLLWAIFPVLDPDPGPQTPLNPNPIRIRIRGTGSFKDMENVKDGREREKVSEDPTDRARKKRITEGW